MSDQIKTTTKVQGTSLPPIGPCATCGRDINYGESYIIGGDLKRRHNACHTLADYKSNTTGQRDGLGYLRWTPTACRRCGYEQVDCTCIGGFVAPQTTVYRHDLRCPDCNLNWWLFPPAHIHGLPMVRCVECKRVYDEDAVNV